MFYKTSSSLGPLPFFLSLQFTIAQSKTTGITDHILPLGDPPLLNTMLQHRLIHLWILHHVRNKQQSRDSHRILRHFAPTRKAPQRGLSIQVHASVLIKSQPYSLRDRDKDPSDWIRNHHQVSLRTSHLITFNFNKHTLLTNTL